jgi:hypothetical protein
MKFRRFREEESRMKGLDWESFKDHAVTSLCKDCEHGHALPWRNDTTCLQAWLRFHSSRGLILECNASRAGRPPVRLEDRLMYEGTKTEHVAHM